MNHIRVRVNTHPTNEPHSRACKHVPYSDFADYAQFTGSLLPILPNVKPLFGLLACCLLATAAGCAFHRTEHGFVLRSNHWLLEHNRESLDLPAQAAAEEPETLPWRSRLKGYRLGSRMFQGRQSVGEPELPDNVEKCPEPKRPDLVVE